MSFFIKIITRNEFRDIKSKLHSVGLSWRDIREVEEIFQSNLHEKGMQKGIDLHEVGETLDWMKDNMNKHRLERSKIDKIEEVFKSYL